MAPGLLSQVLQRLLKLAGKEQGKVVAVFGFVPAACHVAVLHVRKGEPDIPVWLFSTVAPMPATTALCDRVHVSGSAIALLIEAERRLWRRWVALSVGTWTGERGSWLIKLAPFLIPPFRALVLNGHGDFFRGGCQEVLSHCLRQLGDRLHSGWNRGLDLAGAGGLLLVSVLLRCGRYPHRRVFGRLHGKSELCVDPVEESGGGFVRYVQRGQDWDGAALERLAHESAARWILWTHDSRSEAQAENLTELFDSPGVFGVARQTHSRGWKRMLIPTAPFRRLQEGEASRVLAPLSDTILVDRAKLLAVGIPRCKLAGTAWMLMYWKAAAAGWRSYIVGHSGPVEVEPDFPMHETDFLLRVLGNGSLRRLGPRDPELSRGTVAFRPAPRPRTASGAKRLKVLLVSPFLPYPLTHGGAVRIYNLCRALADRVDFILVAVREADEAVDYERLGQIFREVHVVDLDEPRKRDSSQPEQVRHYRSASLRAAIARICHAWNPDLLQVEYTQMAGYRDCAPGIPAILVEHDLTISLYRQLAADQPSREAHAEYLRWLEFERHWLKTYDEVWTVSEDDRRTALAEGQRRADRTLSVPNGVDLRRYVPEEMATAVPEILFVGSFRHRPNVIGFERLRRDAMPRIWERFPQARLRVVAGPRHEQYLDCADGDPRIEILGFVEDLRPLYATASVVAIPLPVSAGTNIKVLEAMACAKAIVTTVAGCAGLDLRDGQDALIRDDWGGFAEGVCELLANDGLRYGLGTQARSTAEARFGWEAIADRAYANYEMLAGRGRRLMDSTGFTIHVVHQ